MLALFQLCSEEPREKRVRSAEGQEGMEKTSGSMFSWLLRDHR